MRENLNKENEDEEDIQLNFQYKLYKGFVKETNLSLNAYNDYNTHSSFLQELFARRSGNRF